MYNLLGVEAPAAFGGDLHRDLAVIHLVHNLGQGRTQAAQDAFATLVARLDAAVTDTRRPLARRSLSAPILGSRLD